MSGSSGHALLLLLPGVVSDASITGDGILAGNGDANAGADAIFFWHWHWHWHVIAADVAVAGDIDT